MHQLKLVLLSSSCSNFFCSLARSGYYCFFSPFNFNLWFSETAKGPLFGRFPCFFFSFFFCWWSLLQDVWPRLVDSFAHIILLDGFWVVHIPLFIWSNLIVLHNSQWITFPTQSCLVLYTCYVNLLYSLIILLIILSQSPHNLHLLFCCVLLIFALM